MWMTGFLALVVGIDRLGDRIGFQSLLVPIEFLELQRWELCGKKKGMLFVLEFLSSLDVWGGSCSDGF